MKSKPHPKNAAGPFYVINGGCIFCTAPEVEAPDLMGHDEPDYHCFFRRQPETPEELERAVRAVWVSCCGAVRYGGTDPEILRKLAILNPEACDKIGQG